MCSVSVCGEPVKKKEMRCRGEVRKGRSDVWKRLMRFQTKRRKERGKGQRENPPEKGNEMCSSHHTHLSTLIANTTLSKCTRNKKTKSKSAIENVASYPKPTITLRP